MNTIPVFLDKCTGYTDDLLSVKIDGMASKLGLDCNWHGKKVLLKPNLLTGRAPNFTCTNGLVIAVVAKWFIERGANVSIGDSPAFGTAEGVMKKHGILDAIKSLPVDIVEFKTPKEIHLTDGSAITVAAEAYDCDLLVNLPKVKAHNQMYVTLAVKNIFGVVKGHKKAMLHISHGANHSQFSGMLLDLITRIPENVTFVDGIEVMHKAGPMKGESHLLACVAAARDPLALDTALISVLGLKGCDSPVLRLAEQKKLKGAFMENITFPMLSPEDFERTGFIAPDVLTPITFHPLKLGYGRVKRFVMSMVS